MKEQEFNERIMKWNERSADSQLNELEQCVVRGPSHYKSAEDLIPFIRSLFETLKNNGIDISERQKRLVELEERMERKIGEKERGSTSSLSSLSEEKLMLRCSIKWLEQYAKGEPSPYTKAEDAINSVRHSIEAAKDTGKDTSAEETLLAKLAERARARDKKEEEEKKKK